MSRPCASHMHHDVVAAGIQASGIAYPSLNSRQQGIEACTTRPNVFHANKMSHYYNGQWDDDYDSKTTLGSI